MKAKKKKERFSLLHCTEKEADEQKFN